ncbi:AraC family transcriptional regulator [Corallococcus sp. CA053C]|nr:AraC family transcriptional regulator [Corallococcus sp. CA053C]
MDVKRFPVSGRLAPFVKAFTLVEAHEETTRTLIPEPGLVLGIRYSGSATQLEGDAEWLLPGHTLTGMRTSARRMRTSAGGGTVLVTFREAGAAKFFAEPLHELFGQTMSLADLIPRTELDRVASQVAEARDDAHRIAIVEQFLGARLRAHEPDRIVAAAVEAIQKARGSVRMGALARQLHLSQDAFEKRFRAGVGSTPKQLASLVRVRHAIAAYRPGSSLSRLALDAGYFDQSHFIREFRAVTGEAPRRFFHTVEHC